jgi:thiamine pyrophosphokinase
MSNKRIAILCNGSLDHSPSTKARIQSFSFLAAVDGGTKHCKQLGLKPDLIIGDLDSSSPDVLNHYSHVPCMHFPKDKDETDLELALRELMQPDIAEITVFGALGSRIDHTLANIMLLTRFPGRLFIESPHERLFVIDKHIALACFVGQILSLIPLNGAATGIHTHGLKWNLSHRTLDKHFMGISNEAIESEVRISLEKGDLLCCLNLKSLH